MYVVKRIISTTETAGCYYSNVIVSSHLFHKVSCDELLHISKLPVVLSNEVGTNSHQ